MEFSDLLKDDVQSFINEQLNINPSTLALQKWSFLGLTKQNIIEQIQSKLKSKTKLPTWFNQSGIVYPPDISIEQCSSEQTAWYKSQLINGEKLIDLTSGLGIDSFYFSKVFNQVICVEQNKHLLKISEHNAKILGADNIQFYCDDAVEFLIRAQNKFDVIYLDPSRRQQSNKKVFLLEDCQPNIIEYLSLFLDKSSQVLVKLSPMLDITYLVNTFPQIKEIYIVSVNNEVKELLILLVETPKFKNIFAVNINQNQKIFKSWKVDFYKNEHIEYSQPLKFLYEPMTCINKTGKMDVYAKRFQLKKISQHTHLYTSDDFHQDFMGRVFEINDVLDYNNSNLKSKLFGSEFSVVTKNFSETSNTIKQKWKVKESSEDFCFCYKNDQSKKMLLLAKRCY